MSKRNRCALALGALALALLLTGLLRRGAAGLPARYSDAGRPPAIFPDYNGVVLPPNIAPLNFVVREPGRRFVARLSAPAGKPILVAAAGRSVIFPLAAWRSLVAANAGRDLTCDLYAQDAGGAWTRFAPMRSRIAAEPVDDHLVCRLLGPAFNLWRDLGIYQRDLTGFDERAILVNNKLGNSCLNCHTFLKNRPDTFLFHLRPAGKGNPAMVIARGGKAVRIDTRTEINKRPATYSCWHPDGKIIAFSHNKIHQFFHTAGSEARDVVDLDSGLALYWVDRNEVTSSPAIDDPNRLETFPTWAPDGKALYFCSAPILWPERRPIPFAYVDKVRYELRRVSFDPDTGKLGKPEVVVRAEELDGSLLEPRISPDGRFLLFTRCDYGSFPIFQAHSDLYLLDLERGGPPRRVDASPETQRDSWHSWSSNGRWIVFSRKKDYGLFARPYLRYVDAEGRPAKPLMLPQEDPTYYDRCANTYNAPELVNGEVRIPEAELARAANGESLKATGR